MLQLTNPNSIVLKQLMEFPNIAMDEGKTIKGLK